MWDIIGIGLVILLVIISLWNTGEAEDKKEKKVVKVVTKYYKE